MAHYYVQDRAGRRGPFTPAQVRSMWSSGAITSDAKCQPEGADSWFDLAEQIEQPRSSSLTVTDTPVTPPASVRAPRRKYARWIYSFWIPHGRRERGAWFLWSLAHLALFAILTLPFSSDDASDLLDLWVVALSVCWIYLTLVNAAKRLHDLNLSGWFAPFVFVPLVPLLFLVLSGTPGMNRFGEGSMSLQ